MESAILGAENPILNNVYNLKLVLTILKGKYPMDPLLNRMGFILFELENLIIRSLRENNKTDIGGSNIVNDLKKLEESISKLQENNHENKRLLSDLLEDNEDNEDNVPMEQDEEITEEDLDEFLKEQGIRYDGEEEQGDDYEQSELRF